MGSKTKEVTGFQIEPLTEHPENVYRDLFLNVGKQGRNGGKALTDTFGSTIRELNGILQPKLVAKMGYETSYDMPYKTINTAAIEASASTYLAANNIQYDSIASVELRDPTPKEALLKKLSSLIKTWESLKFEFDPITLDYITETGGIKTEFKYTDVITSGLDVSGYYYKEKDADGAAIDMWMGTNYPSVTTDTVSVTYSVLNVDDIELNKEDSRIQQILLIQKSTTTTTIVPVTNPTTGVSSSTTTSSTVTDTPFSRAMIIPHTTIVGDSPYKDFAQLVMSYNGYSYAAEDYLYNGDTPSIVHIVVNTTYLGGTQYSVTAAPGLFTRNANSEAIKYVVSKIEAANTVQIFLVIKYMNKGDEYLTFVRVDDNANFYKIAHADAMPLLPLKEDFKVLEKDKKLNKLLGEIGIQQSAFKETLESKDLHSAYISFLVPLDLDVPELVDYAYTFFTEVAPDATNTIQMSQRYGTDDSVKINWTFTVTNTTMVGSIGAIDKLTATLGSRVVDDGVGWFGSEGTDTSRTIATLTLKKQLTENSYKEIHISDGGAAYAFDRWRFDEGSASIWTNKDRIPYGIESEYFRLPLLRPAFIAMPFNVKCFIFGKSLCMLAFILKYVKVKWYQTGLFKIIMMAVSIVLMVWAGIPPGWIMASVGLQMAVMAGLITGKVAMIIGIVVALVSGNFQSMVASATKDTLALASTLVNVVSGIYGTIVEGQIKGYAKAAAAATAEADKAREELKEETDTLGNPINLFGATLDYNSYWYIASGEVQYAYDSLYDYDTAIFNTDSKTSIGM